MALSATHRAVVHIMEGMGLALQSEYVAHTPTMLHAGFPPLLLNACIVAVVAVRACMTVTPRLRGSRSANSEEGGAIQAHMLGTVTVPRKLRR